MDTGRVGPRKRPVCKVDGCDKTVWREGKCRKCNHKDPRADDPTYDWVVVHKQWYAGKRDDSDRRDVVDRSLTWRERAELVRRADHRRMTGDAWEYQTGLDAIYLRRWRVQLDNLGMRLEPHDHLTALKWSGYEWTNDEESDLVGVYETTPAVRGSFLFGDVDQVRIIFRPAVTQHVAPIRRITAWLTIKQHAARAAKCGKRLRPSLSLGE